MGSGLSFPPLFPAPFVEEVVHSTLYVFGDFVKYKVGIAVGLISYSVSLVFISVFVPVLCYFYC
jgi:hypothetical protein